MHGMNNDLLIDDVSSERMIAERKRLEQCYTALADEMKKKSAHMQSARKTNTVNRAVLVCCSVGVALLVVAQCKIEGACGRQVLMELQSQSEMESCLGPSGVAAGRGSGFLPVRSDQPHMRKPFSKLQVANPITHNPNHPSNHPQSLDSYKDNHLDYNREYYHTDNVWLDGPLYRELNQSGILRSQAIPVSSVPSKINQLPFRGLIQELTANGEYAMESLVVVAGIFYFSKLEKVANDGLANIRTR